MAKRKSNRAARRLLCMPVWLSNRKQMSGWPSTIRTVYFADKGKRSARQNRKAKEIAAYRAEQAKAQEPETATCTGCGKRGESNQKDGGFYCYGSDRCCP